MLRRHRERLFDINDRRIRDTSDEIMRWQELCREPLINEEEELIIPVLRRQNARLIVTRKPSVNKLNGC